MKKYFKKTVKKIILSAFIISEVFLLSVSPAMSAFSIPSFESVADEGEDRYNVDGDAVRDMARSMNVGGLKSTVPELMIIFSPQNPNPGEEVSAQALPMYFSNDAKSLYFTWYLRHNSEGGDDGKGNVDWNNDNEIDIEDYKIEAMRILAQGGWEPDLDSDGDGADDYSSINAWYDEQRDDDNDGYKAISGGDNKRGMENYCYLHDYNKGKNYEFIKNSGGSTPDIYCPNGGTPVCATDYAATEMKPIQPYDVCADDNNREGDDDSKNLYCKGDGPAYCRGRNTTPVCYKERGVDEEATIYSEEILRHGDEVYYPVEDIPPFIETESCGSFPRPQCRDFPPLNNGGQCHINGTEEHLFARAPGFKTGDNSFDKEEERFWGTNPHDPSTAGNGYSDEAVVAGLGQEIFKWAYQEGDLVGVVIEGTSILTTKHEDSSNMIMWAFVNNHCSADAEGFTLTETSVKAKNYTFTIDAIRGDINEECLKKHSSGDSLTAFMDPVGGASENLDLKLSYTPEFPINDPTGDLMGDIVSFQAIINNSNKPDNELLYNWDLDICKDGTFNCSGGWDPIDGYLTQNKLLKGGVKGNGLSELKFGLGLGSAYDSYFPSGIGYIRAKVKVRETFSSGMSRQGIATAVMKVISTGKKIKVFKVGNNNSSDEPNAVGSPNLKLVDSYNGDSDPLTPICASNAEANASGLIEGGVIESNVVCRVMKNEIIGLQVPDSVGDNLSNFNWTLDGKPLVCDEFMSQDNCRNDNATNTNFFPVTKGVGESYTLTVTATENVNPTNSGSQTAGKKITMVKRFEVIEPYVKIVSEGEDLSKTLGNYVGLDTDANGGQKMYEDKSESVFEVISGKGVALKAELHPSWINIVEVPVEGGDLVEAKEWLVDGLTQVKQAECVAKEAAEQVPAEKTRCVPFEFCAGGGSNCISFSADKKVGEAYSISFAAAYNKDLGVRRALLDLWDVIQQESGDGQLADTLVLEVVTDLNAATSQSAPKRFLASLSANLPGQVIFLLRIILTGFVIILVSGTVFSLSARREEVRGRD